ncbi:MAG: hypothetical protein ACRED4_06955, partial [Brevundimonas sp.]
VTLPVYKMASVFVAHERSLAGNTMAQYSDIIAMDLTITWLERSVMQLESGSRNLVGIDQEQMRDWRASIDSVRKQLTEKQQLLQGKSSSIEAMIARAQAAERVIAARAGSSIADSVTFASNLQP